ncbi:uncharacterized protein [Euwallacea fornicatus]|uniref:uncharacterized protein n=1 Tax=Euwallacea fornicatus TaxID=995702 RepID=UPI00338D7BBC
MFWIVLLLVSLILFLSWVRSKYSFWEKRGVKGPKPIPLLGNIAKHVLGRCTIGQALHEIYRKYDEYPFVGLYKSMTPILLVRDPDFVSKILVKDFKSFRYNEIHLREDSKSLFAQNPFLQRDEKWKQTRQMITPGMSSGKMKTMFATLQEISKNFVKYIENHPRATTEGIETRALTKRLTLDNVAKSAFGIDGKAFESYEDISEFNKLANSFLNPGTMMSLFFAILQIFPQISTLTESVFSSKAENQLKSVISDTINYRKTKNIRTTDYLQFLMDQSEQYNWNDHITTSHACTLFIDGYETSSLVLSYLLLDLAENPQYQQKIRDEIKKSEDENQGELTYDALHQLPWLNACFYESIRYTPPADIMTKICTESFEYTPANSSFKNMTIRLSPGDKVILPYSFLMKDDKHFENADKFMPERMFTNTDKSIFFPFSDGPRACIGQRLGIMQVKLGAASVIKNFELSVSPKLQKPYKMFPYHFMNEIIGGIWIKYKKITNAPNHLDRKAQLLLSGPYVSAAILKLCCLYNLISASPDRDLNIRVFVMISVLIATCIVLIVLCHKIRSYYWTNRNVPGPKPWPIVGNIPEHIFGRKTLGQVLAEIYRKYQEYPFVGIFRAITPCLLVRDPDFVNKILVRDHKAFYNNDFFIDKKNDPLFGQNPFVLRDQEWKETRHMLTPGFTSGKMKNLFPILWDVSKAMINFIESHPNAITDGIETKDLSKRFTLDNVARVAFGFQSNSFEDYRRESEFMTLANRVLTPGSFNAILQQLNAIMPFLGKLLAIKVVPKRVEQELSSIVASMAKHRQELLEQHNDYFQFILQIAKEKRLTNTDIAAHGVTFFFDGYESSAVVLTFALLNLATHPKYQEKIREEMKFVEQENEGGITYETLSELKWTDACIYESLRYTPFMDVFVKVCTQAYEYTPDNPEFKKISVKLYPGDKVIIPYSMLMRDEKYFENPDQFMPERMMERDQISKSIFFPFGNGPRSCIGQRFGLMQVKLGLAQIIKHFDVSLSPKTEYPHKLVPFHFLNAIQGGCWLRYKKVD